MREGPPCGPRPPLCVAFVAGRGLTVAYQRLSSRTVMRKGREGGSASLSGPSRRGAAFESAILFGPLELVLQGLAIFRQIFARRGEEGRVQLGSKATPPFPLFLPPLSNTTMDCKWETTG